MTVTLAEQEKPAKRSRGKGKGKGRGSGRPPNLSALQDGLRAKTYPLPNETDAAAERAAKWHNYYNPQSPAAIHLTNECARATMIADRLEKFHQAQIERQKVNVKRNWRRRRRRKLEKAFQQQVVERANTLGDLPYFSEGCERLRIELGDLIKTVESKGFLTRGELEYAYLLHGIPPLPEAPHANALAYTLHTLNLACTPGVTPEQLDAWLEPAKRLEAVRDLGRDVLIPGDAAACRQRQVDYLKLRMEELARREARLRAEEDDPELRRLLDEAETLNDKAARKVDRCHAEARITFDRALKALFQTLERDAEEADASPPDDDFPDSDECDDEDDEAAQTLSPRERVAEGRVRADAPPSAMASEQVAEGRVRATAPPSAMASSRPVEEAADRVQPVLPNDAEIPPDAPSQVIEAKDDSIEDQGAGGAVPSCSTGALRDGHDDPAPEAEATTGAGVVRDGPAGAGPGVNDIGGGTATENDRGRLAAPG